MIRKFNAFVVAGFMATAAVVGMSGPAVASARTLPLRTMQASPGHFVTQPATFSLGGSAGYLGGTGSPSKTKLSVSVPVIDCSTAAPDPLFVQAFLNGNVAGGAFSASGFDIGADCSGTTPSYDVELVLDDANNASLPVSGGDMLSFDGTSKTRSESYTLTDLTTGQSVSTTGPGLTPQSLQLTVQGGFSGAPTFPPFTSIKYSGIKVNGAPFSNLNPGGSEEVDASNRLEIRTSALSASGEAFTLTYIRNT